MGAIFGTSNTTTFVESASGIGAGGRTGLTSCVTALCFLIAIVLSPVAGASSLCGHGARADCGGCMMLSAFKEIKWEDFSEAVPAFFAGIFMALCYSISYGIASGFIFYCIIKVGEERSAQHPPPFCGWPPLCFVLNFIILAIL